jgi:hypothetical protein
LYEGRWCCTGDAEDSLLNDRDIEALFQAVMNDRLKPIARRM